MMTAVGRDCQLPSEVWLVPHRLTSGQISTDVKRGNTNWTQWIVKENVGGGCREPGKAWRKEMG